MLARLASRFADSLRRSGVSSVLRWIVLATISGVLAGVSSFVFLKGLEFVTDYRTDGREWLVTLLPVAGLAIGSAYYFLGGRSAQGSNLLLDEIYQPTAWVPRRMAPMVLIATWLAHLFGASVGREGTAVQMSGSLSDGFGRAIGLADDDRRIMLITSIAAGFGAVFGVPFAGAVFALEVQPVGRVRPDTIVAALTASLVGDAVVRALGYEHQVLDQLTVDVDPWLVARVAAAGVLFGLVAAAYSLLTHRIKDLMTRFVNPAPLRPVIGGLAIMALVLFFGHDYQGLSLPLIDDALDGQQLIFAVFALKLLFTAVSLGSGFIGGEVTPLFMIGATFGSALAAPLGLPTQVIAAVGFCAVFAGAANTPIACTIIGIELFGSGIIIPLAVGCVLAFACSGRHGIYSSQRTDGVPSPSVAMADD